MKSGATSGLLLWLMLIDTHRVGRYTGQIIGLRSLCVVAFGLLVKRREKSFYDMK